MTPPAHRDASPAKKHSLTLHFQKPTSTATHPTMGDVEGPFSAVPAIPDSLATQNLPQRFRTVFENTEKDFKKTPTGRYFTKDMNEIFSLMIITLNLQQTPPKRKTPSLAKVFSPAPPPFSFSYSDGVSAMGRLHVEIGAPDTCTTIRGVIRPAAAEYLLSRFYEARLVHAPLDRTCPRLKRSAILQPTAKGVAIVERFCALAGPKDPFVPKVISSAHNSMDLLLLERDATDRLITSPPLVELLFRALLGPKPNVYSPTNPPEPNRKLPGTSGSSLGSLGLPLELSTFPATRPADFLSHLEHLPDFPDPEGSGSISSGNSATICATAAPSPYFDRYFTHPDSDSHTQYFVSHTGVRLLPRPSRTGGPSELHLTGKAMWQWFLECSDAFYPAEVAQLLDEMLELQLIVPASDASRYRSGGVSVAKEAYYAIGPRGLQLLRWRNVAQGPKDVSVASLFTSLGDTVGAPTAAPQQLVYIRNATDSEVPSPLSDSNAAEYSFDEIMADPGLKYLFKQHLAESFCAENLVVYDAISELQRNIRQLDAVAAEPGRSTRKLSRMAASCLAELYGVYGTYIAEGSVNELNLKGNLRRRIVHLLTKHPEDAESFCFQVPQTPTFGGGFSEWFSAKERKEERTEKKENKEKTDKMETPESCSKSMKSETSENTEVSRVKSDKSGKSSESSAESLISRGSSEAEAGSQSVMRATQQSSEQDFEQSLRLLHSAAALLAQVQQHLRKMMEYDSLKTFRVPKSFG